MSLPLSVIITTFNEADHIERALRSVAWADEWLVVDSFSTDDTVARAKALGAKVVQRTYTGPADQKNWAIPQASHNWILLLDADEEVSPNLAREIQDLLALPAGPPQEAYWIPRRNYFMGQQVRFSGWQGDKVVRFFERDRARYNTQQVHEEIITDGLRVGKLKHFLEHYTFRSLDHFLDKTRRYARWSAQDHAARTPKVTYYHLVLKPLFRFCKHFILQQGFRDGKVGFVISVVMAWGVCLRYLYLKESYHSKVQASES
ncbi:MAG: glycosyltransferase family 2 protein [Bacteroidetes bacterium]|nr:MAG: glycosyltransferase family 2 protein [Bacteroidota bacterium]